MGLRVLTWTSGVAFIGLVLVMCVGAFVLHLGDRIPHYPVEPSVGCNYRDALFLWIECRGFFAADVAALILTLPIIFFFLPVPPVLLATLFEEPTLLLSEEMLNRFGCLLCGGYLVWHFHLFCWPGSSSAYVKGLRTIVLCLIGRSLHS
jgi:hypothetical protein